MQPETYYDAGERLHQGGWRGPEQQQLAQARAAAHRGTTLPSSSQVVIGAYTPARSVAQGETAAILGQGPPLLVHTGGVHLQQA